MSKETLQHTMRSKVRVFEDGGIRLLRKGQKGLIHAIFSRFGLVLVLLVLQFGALFSLMRWFSNLLPHYLGGTLLVTAAMMVYLLNQDMNNSVRIPWLVVTALAPVLGVLLFFAGMFINLHSDHVIRHLRKPGDTRHYLPAKGLYRYVTSANYFGELVEWTGFAILTASPAAWVFVWWTFANLVPRSDAIYRHYRAEFGDEAVGKRKRIIPYIY